MAEPPNIRMSESTSTSGGRLPFGKLLRQFRIAKGLSQEALAERARISLDTVGALERGRRQAPHRETLTLISEGLALTPDEHTRLEAAATASSRIGHPRINQVERIAGTTGDAAAPAERQHNVPYAVNSFHGRHRELSELTTLIRSRRLVTLHGVGGVGKTRLAIEAARAQLEWDEFRDGLWFVDLGVVSDPDAVIASVAHVLGVREVPNEPLLEAIVDTLRDERLLLILDNCEHVLEPAARIAQRLVQACPAVRVLVTSREALEIDGELVYHVEALALPSAGAHRAERAASLDELRESAAVQLFLDRAHDADPHFFLAAAARDPGVVAEICERLDGLPLTLELAAARVRDLTLPEIRDALDSRFSLLAHGRRTAQHRHRTLRAMLEWSYGLLNEGEQRIFRRLGVFAGSWTVEAAVAVCGAAPEVARDGVATLVSKSLVAVVHGAGSAQRYRLLDSLRAFARALAVESAQDSDIARLHAEYYRDRAQAAEAAWRTEPAIDPSAAFGALIADIADVRAALDWSLADRNDVVLGAELTSVLADAWVECGLDAEGLRLLDASRAALGLGSGPPRAPSLRIRGPALEPNAGAVETGPGSPHAAPDWLESFASERTYLAGDVIFRAGEEARELLYVVSGTVALEEIGLEVGAHELLGEIAFFSAQNRRSASALCRTDVVVRSIGQDALVDLYEGEPSFRLSLIAVFTRRLLQDLESMRDRKGGSRT
jgi:predicted ATPase/DNA-binding XRE family transcriptional regulator